MCPGLSREPACAYPNWLGPLQDHNQAVGELFPGQCPGRLPVTGRALRQQFDGMLLCRASKRALPH